MKIIRCCECDYWSGRKKLDGGNGSGKCAELTWLVNSFDTIKGEGIRFEYDEPIKVAVNTEEDFFCGKFVDKSKGK
jgi:hypothetical protein